jgi:hypothetical protein
VSVAEVLHTIAVPFDVTPVAPSGEQNAPGLTVFPAGAAAVVGAAVVGLGAVVVRGAAVVVRGAAVVVRGVVVGTGVSTAVCGSATATPSGSVIVGQVARTVALAFFSACVIHSP